MNQITYKTTKRAESWAPSMSGLGEVHIEAMTRVSWNDEGKTELVINDRFAEVRHNGETHWLQRTNFINGMQDAFDFWVPRIQKRLEAKRLQDRVKRGWKSSRAA